MRPRLARVPSSLAGLLLGASLASAQATPATPATTAVAGAGPVALADIERAFDAVAASARETDVAKSRALAAGAVGTLQAALERGPSDCRVLAVAAEAQIRAGQPRDAARTTALGIGNDCDLAAMFQLSAWACEYDDAGERRSPKSDLKRCEELYEKAAELFGERPDGGDAVSSSLANAAELAEIRGDYKTGAERARKALARVPPGDMKTRLGLIFLRCEGRLVGEGAAVDALSAWFDHDALLAVIDLRLIQLKARLDVGHDDAVSLAAVAFYSVMTGSQSEIIWAGRYLGEAAAIDESLPDLWYLTGRVADHRAKIAEAASAYRRQIADHPGKPATRLAVNDLAHLLATSSAPPQELAEALRWLDAELAKTPEEVAMIDTRGHVLIALGRITDGLAALRRAQTAEPTPERKAEIDRLEATPR